MFPQRAFSLANMIGRVNKTLNFANQVIPLYMKAKPMVQNAKDAWQVAKVFLEKPKNSQSQIITSSKSPNIKKEEGKKIVSAVNNPVFFV